ncbi:MAG: four helix bundle protein [Polyangiaceae bacterium]|nr:four helix bundle protein [Polyangiaceae bacterium]
MALQIHTVSIETITLLRPLVARIRRFDLSLAKQLSRSASSIALNIGEGEYSSGGTRRERYLSAAGSASETRTALEVAAAWGYVRGPECAPIMDKLDHLLAVLWRLTRG